MSKTFSNKTSHQTVAQQDYYRSLDLSLVLGYTDKDKVENSEDSYADSAANSSFASRITDDEILTVVDHNALYGGNKKWVQGAEYGNYQSSGDINGQYLIESAGFLFMVVGFSGNRNRTDLGAPLSTDVFTDISGAIASTTGGIEYCAINALQHSLDTTSSKYSVVSLPQQSLVTDLASFSSFSTRASNACGSGNETITGTCCLYHKHFGYDAVAGTTYGAGEFYKCDCTKCYKCLELADAFDMNYIFTAGTGGTASSCVPCDSETIPTDCGPCACSIDWDDTSLYSEVLSNSDISSSSSTKRNAGIIKEQAENGSGVVTCIEVDLKGLSTDEKTLSSSYDSLAEEGALYVPIRGSCKRECLAQVSVVKDAVTRKWQLDGIRTPSQRGSEYTSIEINEAEWLSMFPYVERSRLIINTTPIGGFASKMESWMPLSLVIYKTLRCEDIRSVTDATSFNFYTISSLKSADGASLYAGMGPLQTKMTDLVPQVSASTKLPMDGGNVPVAGEKLKNIPGTSDSVFTSTEIAEIIPVDPIEKDENTIQFPLQTAHVDERVGSTMTSENGTEWTIDSIASRPLGSTSSPYDATKTKQIHRNEIAIDLNNNEDNIRTLTIEYKVGSAS
jgi:hypothetical protein